MGKKKRKVRPMEEVWEELIALPSADQIERMLVREGIAGKRKCVDGCPLANWIRRETGLYVCVQTDSIDVGPRGEQRQYQPTKEVIDFIGIFDHGWYPGLCDHVYPQGMEGPPW